MAAVREPFEFSLRSASSEHYIDRNESSSPTLPIVVVQPAWDPRTTKRRGREGKTFFLPAPGVSLYVAKLAGLPSSLIYAVKSGRQATTAVARLIRCSVRQVSKEGLKHSNHCRIIAVPASDRVCVLPSLIAVAHAYLPPQHQHVILHLVSCMAGGGVSVFMYLCNRKMFAVCPQHAILHGTKMAVAREPFEFSLRSASSEHYIERNESSSPTLHIVIDICCKIGKTSDYCSCPVYSLQCQTSQ